jgi:hypothetical protein
MAAENARQSSVASSDGMMNDALRKGEIARRSSMQNALENLDEAADMVIPPNCFLMCIKYQPYNCCFYPVADL